MIKLKTNASDISGCESRLKQGEDNLNEAQRENSFYRGFQKYLQESYTVYECRTGPFNFSNDKITKWKSTGIFNYLENSNLNVSSSARANYMPFLENNGRMNVKFNGYYLAQNKAIHPNNNKVVNIYIVYELGLINNYRSNVYTIQNALFGAMKITKNATNNSKNKYEGYGICFDSGGTFCKGNISDGKNVIIFGVDMSFSTHGTNKANNIHVLGDWLVQGFNDTTIYAEKVFSFNFTEVEKKFFLSLHYNGDNSYLFVNGKQELKFKAKNDQIETKNCVWVIYLLIGLKMKQDTLGYLLKFMILLSIMKLLMV